MREVERPNAALERKPHPNGRKKQTNEKNRFIGRFGVPSGLPDEDFFVCEMENWIKICTVRLVKFPELCYYFRYVRVQFVRLAARLLHKKNYVLWGNRYDRTDNARKNCHRRSAGAAPSARAKRPPQSAENTACHWQASYRYF